jgi:RimJ/RimL family protein N-acetyltransferase
VKENVLTNSRTVSVRPLSGSAELGTFLQLSYVLDHELAGDLEQGRRRPEWLWVAERGNRVVARLAWWTSSEGGQPMALDVFDLDDSLADPERTEIGLQLVATAMAAVLPADADRPEYGRFVPPGWRQDAEARRIVEGRMQVMERTGARLLVERLRLEWLPGTSIPDPTGRLHFRPALDRDELVGLMALVLEDTLDAHSRRDLETMTPSDVAATQYEDEFLAYRTPREWWTIADDPSGDPVGFVIPARNSYHPIIAYIGVVPAHRGHGHVDEILAEGTRILAANEVPRIRASTDVGNVPMAHAFARLGYVNFESAINMVWA